MERNLNDNHPRIIVFEAFPQKFFSNINQNLISFSGTTPPFGILNEIQMVQRYEESNESKMLFVDLEVVNRDNYNNTKTTSKF